MKLTNKIIEIIGFIALVLAAIAGTCQFFYINYTRDIDSFVIYYLLLMIIIEFLWCLQGIFKGSMSIGIAKGIGCIYFFWLMIILIKNTIKDGKTMKEKLINSNKKILGGFHKIFNSIIKLFNKNKNS